MRFKVAGTQPTGKRIELPEIGVMRFADGKWKEAWYFADELGLMLQLNALHCWRLAVRSQPDSVSVRQPWKNAPRDPRA